MKISEMKKKIILSIVMTLVVAMTCCFVNAIAITSEDQIGYVNPTKATGNQTGEVFTLNEGVNILKEGQTNKTFNVDTGKVMMISGVNNDLSAEPIVFENCTFNLTGETIKISGNQDGISYNNGKTATK